MRLDLWKIRDNHCTTDMVRYMAARIGFVEKRRIKLSNLLLVGQMRRRRGTSMKSMMKDVALALGEQFGLQME
jgi:hypothetical protein